MLFLSPGGPAVLKYGDLEAVAPRAVSDKLDTPLPRINAVTASRPADPFPDVVENHCNAIRVADG